MTDDYGPWVPLTADELAAEFREYGSAWWVIGGVAIDLFLGEPSRSHDDVDVEVLRREQTDVQRHLVDRGWQPHLAWDGRLRPWHAGEPVPDACNGVWWRRPPDGPWAFDLKLASADGDTWVYRREPRIRRPLESMAWWTDSGIPCVAPEVQLLFKAKDPRPKDDADVALVVPRLAPGARKWLAGAIALAHPDIHWRSTLEATQP